MTRGPPSLGVSFLGFSGLGGVSSLVFRITAHHDRDRRSQTADEMNRHCVLAELADRILEHYPAAIDLFADEFRQLISDVTCGDGAIQTSTFASAGGELQALAGDLVRQGLKLRFLLG